MSASVMRGGDNEKCIEAAHMDTREMVIKTHIGTNVNAETAMSAPRHSAVYLPPEWHSWQTAVLSYQH